MEGWFIDNLNLLASVTNTNNFTFFNACFVFLNICFAFFNVWIACLNYQCSKKQKEIQNDSFCYQLFDRRLNVYYSIQEILGKLISSPDNAELLWQPFSQKTRDVPFLFGKDIQDKRDEIYKDIVDLDSNNQQFKSTYEKLESAKYSPPRFTPAEYEKLIIQRDRLVKEINILSKKIYDHDINLQKLFQPYISFAKYQITPGNTIKTKERINLLMYPSILSIPPVS